MRPNHSRRSLKQEAVAYTVTTSPVGMVMVAATRRGVCWLGLGDSEGKLFRELQRDLPEREFRRDGVTLRSVSRAVRNFVFRGGRPTVRLDFAGTAFQRAVWRELIAIPPGRTRSYAEIAQRLGRPSSARAVGAAVGANPVSLFIPCHRAVGSEGSLTGYRWGLERKRKSLDIEGAWR